MWLFVGWNLPMQDRVSLVVMGASWLPESSPCWTKRVLSSGPQKIASERLWNVPSKHCSGDRRNSVLYSTGWESCSSISTSQFHEPSHAARWRLVPLQLNLTLWSTCSPDLPPDSFCAVVHTYLCLVRQVLSAQERSLIHDNITQEFTIIYNLSPTTRVLVLYPVQCYPAIASHLGLAVSLLLCPPSLRSSVPFLSLC